MVILHAHEENPSCVASGLCCTVLRRCRILEISFVDITDGWMVVALLSIEHVWKPEVLNLTLVRRGLCI